MMRIWNTGSYSKTVQLPIQGSNSLVAYTLLRRTEVFGFFARSDAAWLLVVSAGNLKESEFKNNLHTKYKHKEMKCAASAVCRQELQTIFSIPGSPGVKNIWNLKDIASTCCKTWWITSFNADCWRWFYERIPPSAIRPRSINTRLNLMRGWPCIVIQCG